MAATPERKVKTKVTRILDEYGVYYFYPVTGGFGRSGVPDIIVCVCGRFLAIECKAGNGRVTALQFQNIERIKQNGGITLVVNEENTQEVRTYIERIIRTAQE
jgi:hypothetical protein